MLNISESHTMATLQFTKIFWLNNYRIFQEITQKKILKNKNTKSMVKIRSKFYYESKVLGGIIALEAQRPLGFMLTTIRSANMNPKRIRNIILWHHSSLLQNPDPVPETDVLQNPLPVPDVSPPWIGDDALCGRPSSTPDNVFTLSNSDTITNSKLKLLNSSLLLFTCNPFSVEETIFWNDVWYSNSSRANFRSTSWKEKYWKLIYIFFFQW